MKIVITKEDVEHLRESLLLDPNCAGISEGEYDLDFVTYTLRNLGGDNIEYQKFFFNVKHPNPPQDTQDATDMRLSVIWVHTWKKGVDKAFRPKETGEIENA